MGEEEVSMTSEAGQCPVAPAIEVRGVMKRYGERVALDRVDLSVAAGRTTAVLGPNGSGKTTLVEVLVGLREPDAGDIRVLGLDPRRQARELHRRVGVQLQSASLPARLRTGEALRWFAALTAEARDPDEVLREWGLVEHVRTPVGQLSGGLRQRLFLALAMLGQPELILLDELTTGLDPVARRHTWDAVHAATEGGATTLLVTHDLRDAEALCDRAVVMCGGRIVLDGEVADLVDQHGSLDSAYLDTLDRYGAGGEVVA